MIYTSIIHDIFIDGRVGTTGLRIEERLSAREDIRLLRLPADRRKDPAARAEMIHAADVTFLCLPDDAARQAVALAKNSHSIIIDASTAHRTLPGWAYGFPELGAAFRENIARGKRIAVPGCHASGFIALAKPLLQAGILSPAAQLTCLSLTGYSGGGNAKIAEYEAFARRRGDALSAPTQYALGQNHKHLPEICALTGLQAPPLFCPIIADYDRGMEVTIPLPLGDVSRSAVLECYRAFYQGAALVRVAEPDGVPRPANCMRGRDSMELTVEGQDGRLLLIARFDNLGKGASGAAVQCLNLAIGAEETTGLVL